MHVCVCVYPLPNSGYPFLSSSSLVSTATTTFAPADAYFTISTWRPSLQIRSSCSSQISLSLAPFWLLLFFLHLFTYLSCLHPPIHLFSLSLHSLSNSYIVTIQPLPPLSFFHLKQQTLKNVTISAFLYLVIRHL